MSKDNNIKNFTAADIEKYHKGLLSDKERHGLEKAALDDPFLADALEGYAVAGVNVSTDLDELKKRLAGKLESGKLVAMKGAGKTSFPWLRVAALVIVVAGAGFLAKQFIFTGKEKDIAQATPKKNEDAKTGDTINTVTISSELDRKRTNPGTVVGPLNQSGKSVASTPKDKISGNNISKDADGRTKISSAEYIATNNATQPVTAPPAKTEGEVTRSLKAPSGAGADQKKDIAKEESKINNGISDKKDTVKDEATGIVSQQNEERQNNKSVIAGHKVAEDQYYRNQATNTFRGRVTDASNVGVPFANVTNAQDNNAGTYTDAKGFFNLTYPDTVLTVQVRSIGFENANIQLRNNVTNNQVIMQDDRKSLSEVVINNQKPNTAARSRDNNSNAKIEEPVPADGWVNYDAYIANNLNPPDEIKTKQNSGGQVEVSFEVDKNGNPINIKVEKSLCTKCDQEAIRLIKEGPKWKRNAKKGRTTVTVPFNSSL